MVWARSRPVFIMINWNTLRSSTHVRTRVRAVGIMQSNILIVFDDHNKHHSLFTEAVRVQL